MKQILLSFAIAVPALISASLLGQQPGGFSYQAVARTSDGHPVTDTPVSVRFSITRHQPDGTLIWQEEHDLQTSSLGLFHATIGGEDAYNRSGLAASFEDIHWPDGPYYLRVWIKTDGEFEDMGASAIQTVPLARHADMASHSAGNFSVTGEAGTSGSALFEVKRADGMPLFAVYDDGVWVYADTDAAKGVKGGFAVGGYNRQKGVVEEYMRITPDSARIYISQEPVKGVKGGFAVGGYRTSAKGPGDDFLQVTPSSTHVFYDADTTAKGVKGGFAVGGYNRGAKSATSDQLMSLTRKNYFIGHEAGKSIASTGSFNQFMGYQAGKSATDARYNVFMGYQAGMNALSGESTLLIGYQAGMNFNGTDNVVIGTRACYNSSMWNSVVIGEEAAYGASGDGWGNVIMGYRAGYSNKKSGGSGISGARNVFVGRQSGEMNDQGGANVYLGAFAGNERISGYRNVCVGDGAGSDGSEGSNNVYVGERAGYTNRGGNNVVIGREAGSAESNYTLDSDFDNNVMLGYRSGFSNKTGNGNVFLGGYAGYSETGSNRLYIDNSSTSTPLIWGDFQNDLVRITSFLGVGTAPSTMHGFRVDGGSDPNYSMVVYKGAYAYGSGFVSASDRMLKTAVSDLDNVLQDVLKLRGVRYRWNMDHPEAGTRDGSLQIGLIAQEVEAVYPELITETADGYLGVSYGKMSAVLIEAIKEQQTRIEAQRDLIEELMRRIEALENQ